MPALLSCLIVDDEKRAVALLKKLLEETGEFSEIRWAFSVTTALDVIKKTNPNLIFLDIKMPDKDGFALMEELKVTGFPTEVIFVTAFDQFTLKALRNHAFDYLLKPVVREELAQCIQQFKAQRQRPDFSSRLNRFLEDYESSHKIRFNTRTGFFQVDPASIIYCVAEGNYTHINTGDRDQLCTLSLSHVQEMLPQNGFLRIGRSLIINANFICKVDRKASEITFEKGGKFFPLSISTRQAKELDKMI